MRQKLTHFKTQTDTEQSLTSSQTHQRRESNSKLFHHDPHHPDEETTLEQTDTRWNTQTAHDSSSTAFCTYTIVTLKLPKSNTVFISLSANNVNVKPK